jgi:hypothetical protein
MVGALKKWLGIDVLERENLTLARSLQAHSKRIDEALEAGHIGQRMALDAQKELTSEPAKPKIVAKPQRTSWKQFRSAAEKATDPEREEA